MRSVPSDGTNSHDNKMKVVASLVSCHDEGGSKHLWNIRQFLWDCMVQHPTAPVPTDDDDLVGCTVCRGMCVATCI